MDIKQDYLVTDPDRWEQIAPNPMTPTEITFHNTDNDASASAEVRNVRNNSTQTGFHVAVDDIEAHQVIPFNRNAWHAGDGNGTGNRKSIGVEICYSKSGGGRYRKAELNAIEVISDLMVRFNIPISRVKTHQERNGKYCPRRMLDEGRVDWFKAQCARRAEAKKNGWTSTPPSLTGKVEYVVKNSIQTGAFSPYEVVDAAGALTSLKMTGKFVLEPSGLLYIVTDGTSDSQRKAFEDYLKRKSWWYEVK
ncbi:N-acetylmuramoyl-L-alanine amidase C-terminal domain-containing protein [Bacillus cereus]|uniref:N-acetylmuramoyl-L-alanine amidase n=1 Tax=Bacillus cereus TaxID=1396 RepID=UPI0024057AD3|nr:N-acetylmuramoyl-L-alanine amidase [Bacillus cereus]MDF9611908.1 N-acetylmuramoyl-L-alanine amidase C-terminal domain-containing protein [Bacillus cereus]